MHFFNPVPVMALVEVVSGLAHRSGASAETVFATAAAWGKTPGARQIDARLHRQSRARGRSTPRRCACWARAAPTSRRSTR